MPTPTADPGIAAAQQGRAFEEVDDHLAVFDHDPVADRQRSDVAPHRQMDESARGRDELRAPIVAHDAARLSVSPR